MKIFFLSLTVLSSFSGIAQKVVDITESDPITTGLGASMVVAGGEPYLTAEFVRVTAGTPFFSPQWMKATLILGSGKTCGNVILRLNLLENSVIYKDAKGDERIATTPLRHISLRDSIAGTEYNFVYGSELNSTDRKWQKTWFQVLVSSKVSLCKQLKKTVQETTPYYSGTKEETIYTTGIYFVYMNKVLVPLGKWNDLLQLLNDNKDRVGAYIRSNHIKGTSDQDYIQVVNYYNSLQPPPMSAAQQPFKKITQG